MPAGGISLAFRGGRTSTTTNGQHVVRHPRHRREIHDVTCQHSGQRSPLRLEVSLRSPPARHALRRGAPARGDRSPTRRRIAGRPGARESPLGLSGCQAGDGYRGGNRVVGFVVADPDRHARRAAGHHQGTAVLRAKPRRASRPEVPSTTRFCNCRIRPRGRAPSSGRECRVVTSSNPRWPGTTCSK